jgi:GTPase SAR1 family protein
VTAPVQVVEQALAAIAHRDRPDLDARLRHARARLLDEHVRVLVVGEFKQGKSMLVNALVSAPVCPVYDDVATAVPTVVRYGETSTVTLVRAVDGADQGDRRGAPVEVPVAELAEYIARYVSESGNPGNGQRLAAVEVTLPRRILAGGLEIVDTPGVGGLHSVHGAATMATLPTADAVLLVSDASQEYTEPELEFLRQAVAVCPNVACVLTKTDLYPQWRRIAEIDRQHLATAKLSPVLLTVSSTVRWEAVRSGKAAVNEESGFPVLERYLHERVVGEADLLARRSTALDVLAVTGQLAESLKAERTAQQDPEGVRELVSRLTAAQQRAAALKERSARWQHTLNDGVADLNADIDHDLRDRMREIIRLAEDEIVDGGDPTKTWDQISGWVQQQVATAASTNFVWATQRARWLAEQVAGHFSEEREAILPSLRAEAAAALGAVRTMVVRDGEQWNLGQKALAGLRGGYVGVLMFGMLGTLVGMSLINPFSLGAGLLLGGKAITDERRRVVTRRQTEARTAVRRYIDDVIFQVGKDSRDMLRVVQRDLRDHFTEQAEQTSRSLAESVRAAERSVKASQAERARRISEIGDELAELDRVGRLARELVAGVPAADRPAADRPAADRPAGERPDVPRQRSTAPAGSTSEPTAARSGRHAQVAS